MKLHTTLLQYTSVYYTAVYDEKYWTVYSISYIPLSRRVGIQLRITLQLLFFNVLSFLMYFGPLYLEFMSTLTPLQTT